MDEEEEEEEEAERRRRPRRVVVVVPCSEHPPLEHSVKGEGVRVVPLHNVHVRVRPPGEEDLFPLVDEEEVGRCKRGVDCRRGRDECGEAREKDDEATEEAEEKKNKDLDEEEKFDAFGNKIVVKKAATKIPKSELKKIKKQVAALRKQGQEVYTDEEVEKAGYSLE